MAEQRQFAQQVDNYIMADMQAFDAEMEGKVSYKDLADKVNPAYRQLWLDVGLPEEKADQMVYNLSVALSVSAMQSKKSVSRAIHGFYGRLGESLGMTPGEDPSPKPASPRTQAPSGRERVDQLTRAQKLSGLGKTPPQRNPTDDIAALSPQSIADMSDEEYLRMKQDPELGPLLDQRLPDLG